MDTTSIEAELALLYSTVQQTYSANYHEAAAVTVLSYDILLNLATEIEVIWKTSWSLPKVLYLIARYYAPLDLLVLLSLDVQIGLSAPVRIPFPFCSAKIKVYCVIGVPYLVMVDHHFLIFMCIMMFCDFACMLYAALWASVKAQVVTVPSFVRLPACTTLLSVGKVTLVGWISSIVVGSADLFDAIMTLDTHTPITRVAFIWFTVAYSIAGTRILFNLRTEAMKSLAGSQDSAQLTEDSVGLDMFAHQQSV
ncbi:hypothetical protein NM688_g826 [Phlebia brevispora]|uniref:Uncharacterized protein n=1 Tax=Phlebia brevispora TaxID=194682 RepID=A0ACC1TCW9_9APHY|nr:hypothetical protein NM688_g826 [Phlebia brevispora]